MNCNCTFLARCVTPVGVSAGAWPRTDTQLRHTAARHAADSGRHKKKARSNHGSSRRSQRSWPAGATPGSGFASSASRRVSPEATITVDSDHEPAVTVAVDEASDSGGRVAGAGEVNPPTTVGCARHCNRLQQ